MGTDASTLDIAEERISSTEAADTEAIIKLHLAMLDTRQPTIRRGQHPKHHGCVEAEFVVASDVPADLQHGVLSEPRTYRALIRFSNGRETDDRKPDVHGMAVKLLGVAGEKILPNHEDETTQDFLMIDHSVFFIRSVADYKTFSQAVSRSRHSPWVVWLSWLPVIPSLLRVAIVYFGFFRTHKREFKILMAVLGKKPKKNFVNPLRATYGSATAYRLGPHAIRFEVEPIPKQAPSEPVPDSQDRSRLAMAAQLADGDAAFQFCVQRQTDPATMPVEDPTVDWDRNASKFIPVATIHIPSQTFDSPEQHEFCEHLSFTPWHCLPEHQPLGGLNRIRKDVYQAMSAKRHELTGVPMEEPE